MALNANIILGQEDFRTESPQERQAKQLQLQNAQMQQSEYERKMRQSQQDDDNEIAMQGIYRDALEIGPDGQKRVNQEKALAGIQQLFPDKAPAFEQQMRANAQSEQAAKWDRLTKSKEVMQKVLVGSTPQDYKQRKQMLIANGITEANDLPEEFDPNAINSLMTTVESYRKGLEPKKAPQTRVVRIGQDQVTQEFNETNGSWTEIGRGGAFAPTNPDSGAPVAVMGPDGKPVYVNKNSAIGQRPYSATQDAKDVVKVQQQSQAEISTQQVLDQATLLYGHKGRSMGTGTSSWTGGVPLIASDSKDFQKNLDTFKAQTFIPMVSALKGMGALSDAEGKKLAESVGALDPNMSEQAFAESLQLVTQTLFNKAKASGLNVSLPEFAKPKNAPPTTNAYKSKAPPAKYPKARLAPDGNWYIPKAGGGYQMVTK